MYYFFSVVPMHLKLAQQPRCHRRTQTVSGTVGTAITATTAFTATNFTGRRGLRLRSVRLCRPGPISLDTEHGCDHVVRQTSAQSATNYTVTGDRLGTAIVQRQP